MGRDSSSLQRCFRALLVAVAAAGALVTTASPVSAATLTVNSLADTVADDGECTLREAIAAANADTTSGATVGECPAGTAGSDDITFSVSGTITAVGALSVGSPMTISGGGLITVAGNGNGSRIFDVRDAGVVAFSGFTVTGATASNAILSIGFNSPTDLTLTDMTITDNTSVSVGGGIQNAFGSTMRILDSTISNNSGTAGGGVANNGVMTIVNSTISGNRASESGGGIGAFAPVTIEFSTITANTAPEGAGVRATFSSNGIRRTHVQASIIADNLGDGGDVETTQTFTTGFTTGGFNVIGDGDAQSIPTFVGAGDITGAAAGVGPLTNNGGNTETHALNDDSVALDRVTAVVGLDPAIDQRGMARPQGPAKDSGAFEREPGPRDQVTVLDAACAIYDSTLATGGVAGALPAGTTRTISATGTLPADQGVGSGNCLPTNASAAVFTLSAINAQGSGNLRISESGVVANGGVVNYSNNGLNNANTITVELDAAGAVDLFANASATDVRLVAIAYYSPDTGLDYFPVEPCAAADTRFGSGAFAGPVAAGNQVAAIDLVNAIDPVQGGGNTNCGVPDTAEAVMVNLVAVRPPAGFGGAGFLAASPDGASSSEPVAPFADLPLNNAASIIVPLGAGESIAVGVGATTATPSSHVRVVVLGYFESGGGDEYAPITPCAAFDSRPGLPGAATGGFLGKRQSGPGGVTTYQVTGTGLAAQGGNNGDDCGVPSGATAVLVNIVGIAPDGAGNFRAYAGGTAAPLGGVMNFAPLSPAMNNSNAVVVPLNAAGELDLFTNTGSNDGTPTVHARGIILGFYS